MKTSETVKSLRAQIDRMKERKVNFKCTQSEFRVRRHEWNNFCSAQLHLEANVLKDEGNRIFDSSRGQQFLA